MTQVSHNAIVAGVYGGGPIYNTGDVSIPDLRASGFTEVIVWNIAVDAQGSLNFNYEFPLVQSGKYVGGRTHPDFAGNMTLLKQAPTSVTRLTFSVGSSNVGVFQAIKALIDQQGTGPGSALYENFKALKEAIPAVDAIDFDDENCYDADSMTQFSVMLGGLGYSVTLCPYTNASFWTGVAGAVNAQRPGTVTAVHLQCYSGGGGNSPCSGWDFGGVPVYPGLSADLSPSEVTNQLASWHAQCAISGGWIWMYDNFAGSSGASKAYADAITSAVRPLC